MKNEIDALTITEIEQRSVEEPKFGRGITITSGFDLGSKTALDSRSTVKTITERDAHVTGNRVYIGMSVYVEENDTRYVYTSNGTWKADGFNQDDFQKNVVDNLTDGGRTIALSAEQGKVLKGLVDTTQREVDNVETIVTTEVSRLDTSIATKADKAGSVDQDFNAKNVLITGNLTVQGTTTAIDAVNLEVKDNQIVINKDETGAGVSAGVAGIRVERGTETDYLFQFSEDEDMFQIGMENQLETVATRPYVNTEISKIKTIVDTNKTALETEVTRAKDEEVKIRTDFASADEVIKTSLDSEIVRAKSEEVKLQGNIDLKVSKTDIVNVLNTTVVGKVLDARQGKTLNDAISATQTEVDDLGIRVSTNEKEITNIPGKINTAKTEAIADAKTYTDTEVAKKANVLHNHTIENITGLPEKHTEITGEITTLKTTDTALGNKIKALETATVDLESIRASIAINTTGLAQESIDRKSTDSALGGRIDTLTTVVNTKASKTELMDGLDLKVNTSDLMSDDGKINASLMPSLALTETFSIDTEAEMLDLSTAQLGDIAIRSDISKTFILAGTDPTIIDNWKALLTPPSEVTSVAGRKGDVVLTKSDVGLSNVTNESKTTMFTNPVFTGNAKSVTVATSDNSTNIATTAYVKAQGYLTQESTIDGGTF